MNAMLKDNLIRAENCKMNLSLDRNQRKIAKSTKAELQKWKKVKKKNFNYRAI